MNRVDDSLYCTGANERIVKSFIDEGVEFIVIGGLAVSWYLPSRLADDMDLLVNPTVENSERIARALTNVGIHSHDRNSFAELGVQASIKKDFYCEIITPKHDGPTFGEIAKNALQAKLFRIPILIPSVSALIRLKEHAVNSDESIAEKHQNDIDLLKNAFPGFVAS